MSHITLKPYKPVEEATEATRKKRYHGLCSRPQLRDALFRRAFSDISRAYGGETRAHRRKLARARAKNMYREMVK